LRRLREQFPDELVVISVHSAKVPAEKITANIRAAVLRHGIDNPVVNDADFEIWRDYAVRAWPTVILIDPLGKVVGQQAGEIQADDFAAVIGAMVDDFEQDDKLSRAPVRGLRPEAVRQPEALLRFPSKVLAATGGRLFIADTGHHRILEVQMDETAKTGAIVRSFGTGEPGLHNGPALAARFHGPHGLALVETATDATLFVADTENHAVRAIHLVTEQVTTVAGTGEIGRGGAPQSAEPLAVELRSPWALLAAGDVLFIAMAGAHQIWVLMGRKRLGIFAGTGREALIDGPRYEAGFNQPSDLALALGHLLVADAEASAVRAIGLDDAGQVTTLAGQGLFDFGDVDGVGAAVRLQHPIGLCSDGRTVYIADSYNHKIKMLDPATSAVQTLIGTGLAGGQDGSFTAAGLNEPEGLALSGGLLFIADTNNHAIRVADLGRQELWTLQLE
jgi:hypothetical protein